MDTTEIPKAFRFLDLPSELRNRMYEHAFPMSSGYKAINVFDAVEKLQRVALVRVNRQLRHESLNLYREATTNFWNTYILHIAIDCMCKGKYPQEYSVLAELKKKSGQGARIRTLTFHIKFQVRSFSYASTPTDGECNIQIDLTLDRKLGVRASCEVKHTSCEMHYPARSRLEASVAQRIEQAVHKGVENDSLVMREGLDACWLVKYIVSEF